MMNFWRERKTAVLALILILGFLPILGAQTPSLPGVGELLPESRDLHFPESSISKATAGTLSGDPDDFMSTVSWGSIENMENTFVLAGVDEWGLSLGYARKLGKAYLGASYSGDLIDELYRRLTNKEVDSFFTTKTETKGSTALSPSFRNQRGEIPPGQVISNNDINVIFGIGPFGIRLGFAEWIRSVQYTSDSPDWAMENSLESSLKPNLEIGFNIPAGKVTIKPAIRAAFDIREFQSRKGELYTDTTVSPFDTYWVIRDDQINFMEPSAGLSLGIELALSDTTSIEFGLEGDGAFRFYPASDAAGPISSVLYFDNISNGFPAFPLDTNTGTVATALGTPAQRTGDVTIPLDLRATGAPSFAFTTGISDRVTLAAKLQILGGFGWQTIEVNTAGTEVATTVLTIIGAPDAALGASFHLIPDHFSLHAGIGLQLFSYERSTTNVDTTTPAGVTSSADEVITTTFGLPSARFGGGLTINLTQAVALDAMAFSSGLDFDSTLFNLLLTIKK